MQSNKYKFGFFHTDICRVYHDNIRGILLKFIELRTITLWHLFVTKTVGKYKKIKDK